MARTYTDVSADKYSHPEDSPSLKERITSTRDGSITSVQAVYVPADDLTDPAPATTFAHLDATTVLSRKIVEQGIYPAVDPLASTSRILEADILSKYQKIAVVGGGIGTAPMYQLTRAIIINNVNMIEVNN